MNIFIENHQKLLVSMLNHQVKFLLIGGYAVIYHGYKRTTGDMDLWLQPDNANKLKLLEVLKEFEFDESGIKMISEFDFTQHIAFHFWEEPERVDCLTKISNVLFEEAYEMKVVAKIEEVLVPVINYSHLVLSKMSSERMKDRADVEELQKIKNYKGK